MKKTKKKTKTKTFKAKPNSTFDDNDATTIGIYLEDAFPDGKFTPHDIVRLAKPKQSPIHKYFEWDDSNAAALYRIRQARKLITCFVITIDDVEVPGYVSVSAEVTGDDTRQYLNTKQAVKDDNIWESILLEAYKGLISWKSRYEQFSQLHELKPAYKAIDAIGEIIQERKNKPIKKKKRKNKPIKKKKKKIKKKKK